jgi:hypothetical protein
VSADEPAASREDLLALIAVLREQNVALAQRCADLEERNERLTARVAELERPLPRQQQLLQAAVLGRFRPSAGGGGEAEGDP